MKGRIIDQRVAVYSQPDLMSSVLGNLSGGTEVEIESTKKIGEDTWLVLKGAGGQPGYIPGKTRVFLVRQAALNQPTVNAYQQPEPGAPVDHQYSQGTPLTLLDFISKDGVGWLKVRDALGNVGYVDSKTSFVFGEAAAATTSQAASAATSRVAPVSPEFQLPRMRSAGRDAGRQLMVRGALWFGGGVALTCVTQLLSSRIGFGVLFWGAMLYGAFTFIRGAIQYARSPE